MTSEPTDSNHPWYRLFLTREQLDFGFIEIIRAELEEIWISRGGIDDFSVWLETDDEVTAIILAPAAAQAAALLLGRFQGRPCPRPPLEDLRFLLGQPHGELPEER